MTKVFKALFMMVLVVLALVGILAIGVTTVAYISYNAQSGITQGVLLGMFEYQKAALFGFLG